MMKMSSLSSNAAPVVRSPSTARTTVKVLVAIDETWNFSPVRGTDTTSRTCCEVLTFAVDSAAETMLVIGGSPSRQMWMGGRRRGRYAGGPPGGVQGPFG